MADLLIDKSTESLVKQYIPSVRSLKSIAAYFAALSDPTRIKIISALSISSMCVGDISTVLEINQTTVSHQLRILRDIGVVDYKRQGRISFYFIIDKNITELMLSAVEAI